MVCSDGASTKKLFAALEDYERANSPAKGPKPRTYIRNNAWLVASDYVGTLTLYLSMLYDSRVPGLDRTNIYGLLKNGLTRGANRISFSSQAEAIQLSDTGDRLRSFQITDRHGRQTLKIVAKEHERYGDRRREATVREELARLGTVRFPRLQASFEDAGFHYSCEELVLGRRFSAWLDRAAFKADILPQLTATYRAYGVERQSLSRFLPTDLVAKVETALGADQRSAGFIRDLRAVVERNGLVCVSLCHGDLVPSNLAISKTGVVFLDWERSGPGVIAFDLLRIPRKYPRMGHFVAAVRDALEPGLVTPDCDFEGLVTVYTGLSILARPNRAGEYVAIADLLRRS
jgi:hypothetical protein